MDQGKDVIEMANVGCGFNSLLRETSELQQILEACGSPYQQEPTPELKQKILAILNKLQCGCSISKKDIYAT